MPVTRVPRLFEALAIAKGDGRHARLLKSIARIDVLILDDWGLGILAPSANGVLPARLDAVAQQKAIPRDRIEVWFANEAHVGQKNKVTR